MKKIISIYVVLLLALLIPNTPSNLKGETEYFDARGNKIAKEEYQQIINSSSKKKQELDKKPSAALQKESTPPSPVVPDENIQIQLVKRELESASLSLDNPDFRRFALMAPTHDEAGRHIDLVDQARWAIKKTLEHQAALINEANNHRDSSQYINYLSPLVVVFVCIGLLFYYMYSTRKSIKPNLNINHSDSLKQNKFESHFSLESINDNVHNEIVRYHVAKQGKQLGPFENHEILNRLKDGTLNPEDLCWQKGMSDWQKISDIIKIESNHDYPPPIPKKDQSIEGPYFESNIANNIIINGIRGWLFILVLRMIVIGPVFSILKGYGSIFITEQLYPSISNLHEWKIFKYGMLFISTVTAAISLFGGIKLIRIKNWSSVKYAKIALWICGPIEGIIAAIIPIYLFSNADTIDVKFIGKIIIFIFFTWVWTSYLNQSIRVRNTYEFPATLSTQYEQTAMGR